MKIYGVLEKAVIENFASDPATQPKGFIFYNSTDNIPKISNGTSHIALVDVSSVQVLSGKTLTSPTLTAPAINGGILFDQIATPSSPSAGHHKLYYKADGRLYTLDSTGNEVPVGAGSGGGGGVFNLITNGSADDVISSIFVPYADAAASRPVDGTGGSPAVTTSMTSTTPLVGTKSFLLTKPASNCQGQGWAVPFSVPLAFRAKSVKISVDYILNSGTFVPGNNSGTPTDGDVIWYLYDITNNQLIEPSNIKMFSNSTDLSDKFEATFQTSSTGVDYRLLAHVASTSALAYELKVDNVTVTPQNYVYGTPVTELLPQAGVTASWTTNTTLTAFSKREGEFKEYHVILALTGAPNAVPLVISLPDTINTSKLLSSGQYVAGVDQGSHGYDSGTGIEISTIYDSPNSVVAVYNAATPADNFVVHNGPVTWGNGDIIILKFKVPIVGQGAATRMSDGYDGRVISCYGMVLAASINTSGVLTKPTLNSVYEINDTAGMWDQANNRVIIKTAGKYKLQMTSGFGSGSATDSDIKSRFYVNGVGVGFEWFSSSNYNHILHNFHEMDLKVGDYVEFWLAADGGFGAVQSLSFSVTKLSGLSTISASEIVSASMSVATVVSMPSPGIIPFSTVLYDTHGALTVGASAKFRCPRAGLLEISVKISTNQSATYQLYKNGAIYTPDPYITAHGVNELGNGTVKVPVNSGDDIQIWGVGGGSTQIISTATFTLK